MTIAQFNGLSEDAARAELLRCCGSARWAAGMLARRPFADAESAFSAADAAWAETGERDWLEAFAQHPRIGGKDALRAKFGATKSWAQGEQAAVAAADEATLAALDQGNSDYEFRFGHIFIVCATGKSASEMLGLLRARLKNDPKTERVAAAAEQAKITKLRLEKLLT